MNHLFKLFVILLNLLLMIMFSFVLLSDKKNTTRTFMIEIELRIWQEVQADYPIFIGTYTRLDSIRFSRHSKWQWQLTPPLQLIGLLYCFPVFRLSSIPWTHFCLGILILWFWCNFLTYSSRLWHNDFLFLPNKSSTSVNVVEYLVYKFTQDTSVPREIKLDIVRLYATACIVAYLSENIVIFLPR